MLCCRRPGRQTIPGAAGLFLLMAACTSDLVPSPVWDDPAAPVESVSDAVAEAPSPSRPDRVIPAAKRSAARAIPDTPVGGGQPLASGRSSVTAELEHGLDKLTVTAPPLNGIWRLRIPTEMSSDDRGVQSRGTTDLYCRIYHDGDVLSMRCAAAAPLSEPAKAEIDGTQIRFRWPFDKAALIVTVRILSPTELDGEVSVERESAAPPLLGPAHLTKLDPAPPGGGQSEAVIRGVVADLRRGRLDGDYYVADRVDALSARPALRRDELAQLGDLEIVTDLGEMQVLNRDLDTGRKLAGFSSDMMALNVYDLHFAEDSRLCSLLLTDAGRVYSFNCY
jgi:hypothetical protein